MRMRLFLLSMVFIGLLPMTAPISSPSVTVPTRPFGLTLPRSILPSFLRQSSIILQDILRTLPGSPSLFNLRHSPISLTTKRTTNYAPSQIEPIALINPGVLLQRPRPTRPSSINLYSKIISGPTPLKMTIICGGTILFDDVFTQQLAIQLSQAVVVDRCTAVYEVEVAGAIQTVKTEFATPLLPNISRTAPPS